MVEGVEKRDFRCKIKRMMECRCAVGVPVCCDKGESGVKKRTIVLAITRKSIKLKVS